MESNLGKIVSLRVGKIALLTNCEKEVFSAINKSCVESSYLTKTGFSDDEQFDKKHHGGENKAVLFFSTLTYEKIEKSLDIKLDYEKRSILGENILLCNICEKDICVGDILKLGEAVVQVTQPREPCKKLSINSKNKNMLKIVYENGYTGWYAKVLQEGIVKENDTLKLLENPYKNLTIEALNTSLLNPIKYENIIKEAISCEALGKPFKEVLQKLYSKK